MKFAKLALITAIAIFAFSTTDLQAQDYVKTNSVSQQTIENKVYKELLRLPYYGVFDSLKYKVDGDTVTLYGKVRRATNKSSAESVVKRINGVEKVINNIEILPLSSFDDSIRVRTLQELARAGGLYRYFWEPNPSVRIIVDGGHITLEGFVANRGDYNLMNILTKGVPGAFSVENNLMVEKEMAR